jgi:transglutaminase-like putative cysteine protease
LTGFPFRGNIRKGTNRKENCFMSSVVKESPDMAAFLQPTPTIESDHPAVIACAEQVTAGCGSDREKIARLFYFVRDSIKYNLFMISASREDFRASLILEWGRGYCVQKAVLLAALSRTVGIPCRLAYAKIRNHRVPDHIVKAVGTNIFPRHGYNQFYCDGRWLSATAAFDRELCAKNGLPAVEFDGLTDALLPEKDLEGGPYIEYLEKYPATADLAFDWIVPVIRERFGADKRPAFSR